MFNKALDRVGLLSAAKRIKMKEKELTIKFSRKGKHFITDFVFDDSITTEEIINVLGATKEAIQSKFCEAVNSESEKKGRNLTPSEFDVLFSDTAIIKL
ncbi:hypothetical protein PF672P2_00061 [Parabacteroides phage PF672P2]|nr:hypothetical protein PF672P1_00018 [Parabacteroides phage PF672P1]WAX17198.1 hypothetical protein PF672P2_00061 [Parabacteroides phage PF672P2]